MAPNPVVGNRPLLRVGAGNDGGKSRCRAGSTPTPLPVRHWWLRGQASNAPPAYVQAVTVFTVTAAGSLSLVPCKLQRITVLGQAGADATFLGTQIGDKKVDLFKKASVDRRPDVSACGET